YTRHHSFPTRRSSDLFDETRRIQVRLGGEYRRVEALEVPDLQHSPEPGGERDQLARLRRGVGDRLLHENMRAGFEEVAGDPEVRSEGHTSELQSLRHL